MGELLDVRLCCCILDRKRLIAAIRPLSSGEKLEFIAENTDVVKTQIYKVLETESCRIIEMNDKDGSTHMVVEKI